MDVAKYFPGRRSYQLRAAFHWFLDFIIANWGYLLLNNMEYWKDFLYVSVECIRKKLENLNFANWRLFFPPIFDNDGAVNEGAFVVSCFIDNTMFAFCRPGGNTQEGEASPRASLILQQAWWNGWKKLHGMKWQTVILANGMDLNVFGPLSVRRNDLSSLAESKFEEKFRELQLDMPVKTKTHGDSAYFDNDILTTGGGRGLSSVRESIEHSYKDTKQQWKYCDTGKVLQLRKQPVAKIMLVAMLLRNVHVTMNGSQMGLSFEMIAPTFEDWIAQGPRARPIPANSIFSDEYANDEDYDAWG